MRDGGGRARSGPYADLKLTTRRVRCVREAGYEEYFFHRTGHSIGAEVHGTGANMDNLETHDERKIIPWTCFSVEPGIYLPEFGIRSELNMFVGDGHARVTGEVQKRMLLL